MSSITTVNTESANRESALRESRAARSANVGVAERILSTAAGGLLIVRGLQKRSLFSVAGAALGAELIRRGVSGQCMLYRTTGINTAATKPGSEIGIDAPEVRRSITIEKPVEEVYRFWRDPANMRRIVSHFAEVTPVRDGITHWAVRGPLGQRLEWDRSDREEIPGQTIVWHSLPAATVPNRGEITFQPGPDGIGTEVHVRIQFEPPLGTLGAVVAKTLHKIPHAMAGQTLRRFKSLAETGEIPTLEHNPSARGDSDVF
jgi:uncharacterized membrane protein